MSERRLVCERNESSTSAHGHDDLCYSPSTPEPAIDVDVLAAVLEKLELDCDPAANIIHSTCDHDEQAVGFLREYARLASKETA